MKKNRDTYRIVINVNLEYYVKARDTNEALGIVENVELPKEYVTDSFEVINIAKAEKI
jgi:hypothetical protein